MPGEKVVTFPAEKAAAGKPRHAKRADGRYKDVYRYADPATGKRVEKYFYGKTFSEAAAKKKDFIRALESGMDPKNDRITVAQYVEKWLQLRALKDQDRKTTRTFDTHKREAERLVSALGARQLRTVTKSDIEAILLTRKGMSQKAINATYTTFHQIFLSALGDRVILFDPMHGMEKPEGTSGTHRALEEWEKQLILRSWHKYRGGALLMTLLFTGMRRGEACALQWKDVDFDAGTIQISEALSFVGSHTVRGATKTDAGQRVIPILPPLRPVLESIRRPSGPVFVNASGEALNESAFRRLWASIQSKLSEDLCGAQKRWVNHYNKKAMQTHPDLYDEDHPKYTWRDVSFQSHDFRHTYCTMLFDAGVDVKTAQYLMGHASVEVTMRIYNHLSDTRRTNSIEKLVNFSSQWVNASQIPPPDQKEENTTVGQTVGQNRF